MQWGGRDSRRSSVIAKAGSTPAIASNIAHPAASRRAAFRFGGMMTDRAIPEHDSAPECVACGGACCTGFNGYVNAFPTANAARKRLRRQVVKLGWEPISKTWLSENKSVVWVKCRCSKLVDGRCSDYENRPVACKHYPVVERLIPEAEVCPLAARLLRERDRKDHETASKNMDAL